MMWPTLIVDNFFDDPQKIINFSKQFKYERAIDGEWPGTRTPPIGEVEKNFLAWSTRKIMTLFFPMNLEQIRWRATQHFQKIPYKTYGEKGWIHRDTESEFTAIIYLSHHTDNGTALYKPKFVFPQDFYTDKKIKFYKDLKDSSLSEKWRKKLNKYFDKVVDLHSNFNRLVLFDGHLWHGAENFGTEKEDRLTLITFFTGIMGKDGTSLRYPIPMMRRQ